MFKWWMAYRRFMQQIRVVWAEYTGKPIPPSSVDGVRDRNRKEHG